MPIVQVPLDVPDNIYEEVLNGNYKLMGLVKDSQHKIRKHIERAKMSHANDVVQEKKGGLIQVVKEHKTCALWVVTAVAMIGAGGYVAYCVKKRRKVDANEKIINFEKALKEYLMEAKNGKLTAKIVDNLLSALAELQSMNLEKDAEIDFQEVHLTELVFSIYKYTKSLAEVNSFNMKIEKPKVGTEGHITSLKSYLEIQKQILCVVA